MRRYGVSESSSAGGSSPGESERLVPRGDDDVLHARGLAARLLEDLEHRHLAPAPRGRPSRDRHLRLRGLQALRDGRRREPREDRDLNRADVRARVRGDRYLGGHGQEDRNPVALSNAHANERFGELRHLARELRVCLLPPRSVLAEPDRGDRIRTALTPAVGAVPRDVHLAADEPGRPFRPAREVDDLIPGLRELEPHVLDRRRPEPLRILLGSAHELPVVVEAVLAHQPDDVRPREGLLVGLPDELGHCLRHQERLC